MKNTKKLFALVLALVLVFTVFAGCAGGTGSSTGGSSAAGDSDTDSGSESGDALPALDTSEEVELVMYFISDRPAKYDEIEASFNEIFKEKLNCTLKTEWIAWSDYANKYPLLFSSGKLPGEITASM